MGRLRILHAIHDFLPRHEAGSEIYALSLCRELAARHVVHVLAAEYDATRRHGTLTWRVHEGLPVIELVNNWDEPTFGDTWRSPRLGGQLAHVLRATEPDVLHVHSLLNLSLELPLLARAHGIPVVATLHDHTLACPAGGQRLRLGHDTVCETIDPAACADCFPRSHFQAQLSMAAVGRISGPVRPLVGAAARRVLKTLPALANALARGTVSRAVAPVSAADIQARLDFLPRVFDAVALFVAPSQAVADAHEAVGVPRAKIVVSDYGFPPRHAARATRPAGGRVRIGFVGTLVRHKGVHLLLEAARAWPRDAYEIEIHGSVDTFPEYSAHLRRLADRLPVSFLGPFRAGKGDEVYDRFDLLVVPSLWPENSPLVIHEAFLAGVPVAGSMRGGITELVRPGVNGVLFEAGSATALCGAIRPLLEDRTRLARLAPDASVVKSIEVDARDWEARYERVIAGRRE